MEPAITLPAIGRAAGPVAVAALATRPAVPVASGFALGGPARVTIPVRARPTVVPVIPVTGGTPVGAAARRAAAPVTATTWRPVSTVAATAARSTAKAATVTAATALAPRTAISPGASSTAGATASAATRAPTPVSGAATLRRIAVFGHCPDLLHT